MSKQLFRIVALAGFLGVTSYGADPFTIVSLNPLVTNDNAVSEPAIVGHWHDFFDVVVRQTGPTEYSVGGAKDDEDGTDVLQMRLTRVKGELLADLSSKAPRDSLLLPVHVIVRVCVNSDALRVAFFVTEWVRDQITRPGGPAHTLIEDRDLLLTCSTEELQTFLSRIVKEPQAFGEEGNSRRVTDEEGKQ